MGEWERWGWLGGGLDGGLVRWCWHCWLLQLRYGGFLTFCFPLFEDLMGVVWEGLDGGWDGCGMEVGEMGEGFWGAGQVVLALSAALVACWSFFFPSTSCFSFPSPLVIGYDFIWILHRAILYCLAKTITDYPPPSTTF